MLGEIGETDRRSAWNDPAQQQHAERDETADRHDLDHRQQVLDLAELVHIPRIEREQRYTRCSDPHPGIDVGKPPATINGERHGIATDHYGLREPVAPAGGEARPG
jgi:hypothetical protein